MANSFALSVIVVILLIVVALSWNLIRSVVSFFTAQCDIRTSRASISACTYSGKVVWITNATSSLGRALAETLASRGAMLILSSSDCVALSKLPEELSISANKMHLYAPSQSSDMPDDTNTGECFENNVLSNEYLHQHIGSIFGRLDTIVMQAWSPCSLLGQTSKMPADHVSTECLASTMLDAFINPVCQILPLLSKLSANPGVNGKVISVLPLCAILPTAHRGVQASTSAATAAIWQSVIADDPRGPDIVNVYVGNIGETNTCNTDNPDKRNASIKNASDGKYGDGSMSQSKDSVDPYYAADRILAAASDRLGSVIIAPTKDLMLIRFRSWFPSLFESVYLRRPLFPLPSRYYRLSALISNLLGQH